MTAQALGYGGTAHLVVTVKNTGTTDIERGYAVELKSTSERKHAGPDDYIPSGGSAVLETGSLSIEVQRRATAKATFGVALAKIPAGHWGPVVVFGLAPVFAQTAIAVGDAIEHDAGTVYKFKKAIVADIAANNGVGIAIQAAAAGAVGYAFVNFLHTIASNSGYNGAET